MQTAQFSDGEFTSAQTFTSAASLPRTSLQQHGGLHTPGLLNGSSILVSYSGLVLTVAAASAQFFFADGTQSSAAGTTDGANTSSYTVNAAPLVPSSGTVEVYIVASEYSIQQQSFQVVGPPPGHIDYDPTFAPYAAYASRLDSVQITATTTVPDNQVFLEIGRFSLSAGQSSITSVDTSHQQSLSAVLNPTGVSAASYPYPTAIQVQADGRVVAVAAGTNPNAPNGVGAGAYPYPTNVTVGSDGRVTAISAGSAPLENGRWLSRIVYSSSATVTVPAGANTARVYGKGGGGGGAGCYPNNVATGDFISGAGGGAGGYFEHVLAVTPGSSLSVTVGAGGAGGQGSGCGVNGTCNGGNGGTTQVGPAIAYGGLGGSWATGTACAGGQGGNATGANTINLPGTWGSDGQSGTIVGFGNGAPGLEGNGGGRAGSGGGMNGGAGTGGGGGGAYYTTSTAYNGGSGANGVVIIDWYT